MNKFPLVKLFTVDGASCYLYDGRANMFLSLSETEKNLVCVCTQMVRQEQLLDHQILQFMQKKM